MLSSPGIMERLSRLQSALRLCIAEHVHGDALADVRAGADAVDGLLHLAVPAVAPLDGVGGGREQGVVQEDQRLFQCGREELLERLADGLEATDSLAEFGQFRQGGVGPATAVEQTVDLIDDLPQCTQFRPPPRDPLECLTFGRRQVMLDEQVAVNEQVGNSLFEAFLAGRQLSRGGRGPAAAEFRSRGLQLSPHLRHRLQDGPVDLGDDVELADLVRDRSKHLCDGRGIQWRADGLEGQAAGGQDLLESREERRDVFLRRTVVEDFVDQPIEAMVVDDRQDAVRPVIELIGRNIAGEVRQGIVQIVLRDTVSGPFFPPLPPSSGPWRRGRRPDGLAISARMRSDRAGRLGPPGGPPAPRHAGCSGCWDRPSPRGPR